MYACVRRLGRVHFDTCTCENDNNINTILGAPNTTKTETDSWRRAWPATSMLLQPNCLYINIFRRYCSCLWMSSFMYFLMPHSRRVHTYPGSGCEFRGAENSRLSLLIKIYFYSFYFPFEFFPLRCALCTFVSS